MFVAVVWWGGEGGRTCLGGADALFGLGEVAFYGFLADGEVSLGVGICEAWPGGEVAGFDFSQPGEFDW